MHAQQRLRKQEKAPYPISTVSQKKASPEHSSAWQKTSPRAWLLKRAQARFCAEHESLTEKLGSLASRRLHFPAAAQGAQESGGGLTLTRPLTRRPREPGASRSWSAWSLTRRKARNAFCQQFQLVWIGEAVQGWAWGQARGTRTGETDCSHI